MKWGGKRTHIEAVRRYCQRTGAKFTANQPGQPDCVKGKEKIEVKAWKTGRCLDRWYYEREVKKGRTKIVAPCWSDWVAQQAKKDGVKLEKFRDP